MPTSMKPKMSRPMRVDGPSTQRRTKAKMSKGKKGNPVSGY